MSNRINVNMTPNPSDIQTLHCSQGDTEERKFQFVFHNQGEVFDSENISDPVFTSFPVEVGGTEELQPVNGTTPSTSPIIADITYPDGLREGEELTYRESPTTISGNANFKAVYGNTLVWNQIYPNPTTFGAGGTFAFNNGQTFYQNHKYLFNLKGNLIDSSASDIALWFYGRSNSTSVISTRILIGFTSAIWTCTATATSNGTTSTSAENNVWIYFANRSNANITSLNIVDLTQMFGSGNEPTTVEQFTSLFSLPCYDFNQGTLLSFNGTGIKTTGVNLFNINNYRSMDSAWTLTDGVLESNNNSYKNYVGETIVGTGKTYTLSFKYNVSQNRMYAIQIYNRTDNVQLRRFEFQSALTSYSLTEVLENGKEFDIRVFGYSATSGTIKLYDVQLQEGSTATDYEPYTSSTTNLPISTYFPTGMKSAGDVYDELTPSKAITRTVGYTFTGDSVQSATKELNLWRIFLKPAYYYDLGGLTYPQGTTNMYQMVTSYTEVNGTNMSIGFNNGEGKQILIRNDSFTSANDIITALNGTPLEVVLPIATPTETSILSASLVTENGEAPLYKNGDVLECECNENISSEPGFHVAKVKFTDGDGANYSNKIQIHVERSPQ